MPEGSLIVAAYAAAPFYAAYVLPNRWAVVRLTLGYSSLVLFSTALVGFFVPEVSEQTLHVLNSGVEALWKTTE